MEPTLDKTAQDDQADYGLEVLCANWNPLVAAISEPVVACREFVAGLQSADVDSFLSSFYRSQQA